MTKTIPYTVIARVEPDGETHKLPGREGWALLQLVNAGDRGCTPITHPGPRWSGYVHRLRKRGIIVETVHENHGGEFAGHHARYVLRTPIAVVQAPEGDV